MREKIKYGKNESATRPRDIDDDLIKQCREFLAVEVPSSNIVFADEFNRFMPLFNKSLYESTDADEVDKLAREYNSIFSMQHPIQVLSRTPDPQGVLHPGTRKRYRIDRVIPAMFRRVSTLNDLGKKVPTLINAFFNATSTAVGPFDKRNVQYAHAIAEAIRTADKKEGKIDKQRSNFRKSAMDLVMRGRPGAKPAEKKEEPEEDSMTGLIDWD